VTTLGRGKVVALSAGYGKAQVAGHHPKPPLGRIARQQSASAGQNPRVLGDAEPATAERFECSAQLHNEIREQVVAELAVEHAQKLLELTALRERTIRQAHEKVVQLAGLLAQRIIGAELSLDPSKQVDLACQVLRDATGAEQITIFATPEAAEMLRQELCRLQTTTLARIEIVPDTGLSPGDLRIETDIGSIDARVTTQLSHLVSAIVESLHS
jgi:flagellar assembly protein FliH